MKICPTCNTEYDDSTKFCLEDGTRTVDKEQKSQDPLIGQFIDKDRQYQVISLLGEGGMGKVYKGRQEAVGRDVAIKTLHKELLDKEQIAKRFQREARAAAKLKHQHGIDVFTFGQCDAPGQPFDGMPYMVMEFVAGKSLYKVIHEAGKLDEERTIKIMLQVCDVLEEAHRQGIIHRDLKPENIVLTERGRNKDFVKVLDFGIAKLLQEEEQGATKLTKAGTVFGTPEYLSPEQASGTPVDARSDIYSLGIILYEMLTGKVPFQAETAVGLLIKHVNEAPKPIREFAPNAGISEGMERIIMKALSKAPEDRQQSVTELADALRAVQRGQSIAAPAVSPGVAPTMIPGGPPPGMVQPQGGVAPTMIPGGPPPGMISPPSPTTNPPVVPPSVSPAAPPPSVPVAHAQGSSQTLQPMVVNQTTTSSGGGGGAVLAIVLLAVLLGGGGAGAYFLFLKDQAPTAAVSSATNTGTEATASNTTLPNNPTVSEKPATPEQPTNTADAALPPTNGGDNTAAQITPPPVNPPAPRKVTLKFSTSPSGVEVLYNGTLIGVTPLEYPVDASSASVTITFQKEGFVPVIKNITPNEDQTVPAKLTAAKGGTVDNSQASAANTAANTATNSDSGASQVKTSKQEGGKQSGGKQGGNSGGGKKGPNVYDIMNKRGGGE